MVIEDFVRDRFCLQKRKGPSAAVKIITRANAKGSGLLRKHGIVGNEENRNAVVARAIMTSPKIIALEGRDSPRIGAEHDLLVRSQAPSQFRKVDDDDPVRHDPAAPAIVRRSRRVFKIGGHGETHSVGLSSGGLMCRNEYSSETS